MSSSSNTKRVQGTNNNSIVSKCSMAKLKYISDEFVKHFVIKEKRRSPLINRSYYLRARAVRSVLTNWLQGMDENKPKQIVSLGAGFGTTYFWLTNTVKENYSKNLRYFELDFPKVMRQKVDLANQASLFTSGKYLEEDDCSIYKEYDGSYVAIGCDLRKIDSDLLSMLKKHDLDLNLPTLFLSEVVLTYLTHGQSNRVLKWISYNFSNAFICQFEQIIPDDEFGIVMKKHFNEISSPLLTIDEYPTLKDQISRHQILGFQTVNACDLLTFYCLHCSRDEKTRISELEAFDEFEGWHRMCTHYFILCSTNSQDIYLQRLIKSLLPTKDYQVYDISSKWPAADMSMTILKPFDYQLSVYGHTSCLLQPNLHQSPIFVFGGFGVSYNVDTTRKNFHTRIRELLILNDADQKNLNTSIDHGLHSTIVSLPRDGSVDYLLLFGGRSSPMKSSNQLLRFSIDHKSWDKVSTSGTVPEARYRHTTVVVDDLMIVVGGRDLQKVFTDVAVLNLNTFSWKTILSDLPPIHSHACSSWDLSSKKKIVISGGLGYEEDCDLDHGCKLIFIDVNTWGVKQLQIANLPLRYSHTSHIIKNHLFLVGGVCLITQPISDVSIINLETMSWIRRLPFSSSHLELPLHFHGHTSCIRKIEECSEGWKISILVLGGGSNCFSFGTSFSQSPLLLEIFMSN